MSNLPRGRVPDADAKRRSRHSRRPVDVASRSAVLLLVALIAAFPLAWMALSSLKTTEEMTRVPPVWVPGSASLDAFAAVFQIVDFGRAFVNSLLIAGIDTVAILTTSILAGFVFAKYEFRGRDALFYLILATMFVPPIVTLVPLYTMMSRAGLLDSYVAVMVPQFANAFGIFLMRQFIAGVPDELLDAARSDGASEWTVLSRIVTPLLVPAIAVLGLFAFVYQWNNFLWPLVILQSSDHFTVVLELSRLLTYTSTVRLSNVVMAGALISILPALLLFAWLQRFFVSGMTGGALKGEG